LLQLLDTVGDVALIVGSLILAYRLFVDLRPDARVLAFMAGLGLGSEAGGRLNCAGHQADTNENASIPFCDLHE